MIIPSDALIQLQQVISKLDRGSTPDNRFPDTNGEYWALCPFHVDTKPNSFSVSLKGYHCFACGVEGSLPQLSERLNGNHPNTEGCFHAGGLTLESYSQAKRLPIEFLKDLGIQQRNRNGVPALVIPYFDEAGQETATRYRLSLNGSQRFRWKQGTKISPYGVWKRKELLQSCSHKEGDKQYIILVEGESDTQTLWFYNIPSMGIPGATTWKSEWANHLQDLTVYLWQEPDDGGNQFVEAIGKSFPDAYVIKPPQDRKDISECHLFGDDIPTLIEKLRREAVPYHEITQKQEEAIATQAYKSAEKLLHTDILGKLDMLVKQLGLVGEDNNASLLYLVVTSRLLEHPVSVVVKGPSSSGKSYTVETVLRTFPESAYYALSGMSEHALAYSQEPLKHRMFVIYEAAGLNSDFASYLLRSILSEGHLRYETVEHTDNGIEPRLIEREGPTGVILTTTWINMHPENETRMLSLTIKDSRPQTQDILITLAERAEGISAGEPDLSTWFALQTWMELAGIRNVVVPYARILANNTSSASIRMRRDFRLILTLVQSHAMLYQCQRSVDASGRIIASVDDYASVYNLIHDLVSEASKISVKPNVRETVNSVANLLSGKGENATVSVRQIADHLQLDESSATRRAKAAAELGYLKNLEDRKGRRAKYVLDEEMPKDIPALPSPEDLKKIIQCIPPEHSATVQHFVNPDNSINLTQVVKQYLDSPPNPDFTRPCHTCHQIAWKERPPEAGGGYYCSSCHP